MHTGQEVDETNCQCDVLPHDIAPDLLNHAQRNNRGEGNKQTCPVQGFAAALGAIALARAPCLSAADPSAEDSAEDPSDHQEDAADFGIEIQHRISHQHIARPEHTNNRRHAVVQIAFAKRILDESNVLSDLISRGHFCFLFHRVL